MKSKLDALDGRFQDSISRVPKRLPTLLDTAVRDAGKRLKVMRIDDDGSEDHEDGQGEQMDVAAAN